MKFLNRSLIVLVAMLMLFGSALTAQAQGKKALLIVAKDDFEQQEYSDTRSTLEAAGVTCSVASTKTGALKSNKGKRIESDMVLEDVVVADYDAIVLIGGNGIKKEWKNEQAHRIVREAVEQGKVLGAICASPGVLAYADVLNGKKATAHPKSGAKFPMQDRGCDYTGSDVEVDGKLITANGPKAAKAYGEAIVQGLN